MNSEIGRTSIKENIRMKLWAVSAGRCEICNRLLYQDTTLGIDGNFSEKAHIHAFSLNGPRHKYGMSSEEKNSIENLMLLCAEHHHMIDTYPELFSGSMLINMKAEHEQRIRNATQIPKKQSCRMVSYFINIDKQEEYLNETLFKQALISFDMLPLQYPVIQLHENSDVMYVPSKESIEKKAIILEHNFRQWFNAIIKQEDSIAIFALAPQALLIKLGTLLNDQYNTISFQCHRIGHKWAWQKDEQIEYIIRRPSIINPTVALVIDLSAEVKNDRITSKLGDNISIYHLTIASPNRHFVRSIETQNRFIASFRLLMEEIKNLRPLPNIIHLFPVMPNSLAIRVGMDFMPKTDIPLLIYEQADIKQGFFETIKIGG